MATESVDLILGGEVVFVSSGAIIENALSHFGLYSGLWNSK